ncbi:MBL fold metallo-hydrolase [Desulfuribacillus stibiiarsenatis]|uniref:MBL fold metallo-hydrolase n=1 Tax=Desulfuribacillus stibiiarsenatis TaxID=1390249 RepID=A0A1E5L7H7_9FIRM|nr:MBL fold metallo-hydrolase [Desulfuribacillus stibiiarsenatis]OEH85998.1 MBL fold metallo-hydrolase [Desulfuribacillus stibiiarsenatis]
MRQIFSNLDNVQLTTTFKDLLAWRKERSQNKKTQSTYVVAQADTKNIQYLHNNRTEATITSIGHCTFLIQMNGLNILTDPVWAYRMGFAKRLSNVGLSMDELPLIDVVVISHNHYDHLDFSTLKKLRKINPKTIYLVPCGVKSLFTRRGFNTVDEFNWWDFHEVQGVEFHFVPAQHWSKRLLFDTNCSHWGGWVMKCSSNAIHSNGNEHPTSNESTVYFVGDTGYFRGFQLLREKFSIQYMLTPIGAYAPEWFMKIQHMTPEQAVQAYEDCGAKYFIPMHHDAFQLGDDTTEEALARLKKHWLEKKLETNDLLLPKLGETIKM